MAIILETMLRTASIPILRQRYNIFRQTIDVSVGDVTASSILLSLHLQDVTAVLYCMYNISFPAGDGTILFRQSPAATSSGLTSVILSCGT